MKSLQSATITVLIKNLILNLRINKICIPSHLATVVLTRGWVGASPLARSGFATCRTPTLRATVQEETASVAPFGTPGFLGRG